MLSMTKSCCPDKCEALACHFNTTRDDGSETGSERSSNESRKLNIDVFAPMPSAMTSTTTQVKPGVLDRVRTAYRKSRHRSSITAIRLLFQTLSRITSG